MYKCWLFVIPAPIKAVFLSCFMLFARGKTKVSLHLFILYPKQYKHERILIPITYYTHRTKTDSINNCAWSSPTWVVNFFFSSKHENEMYKISAFKNILFSVCIFNNQGCAGIRLWDDVFSTPVKNKINKEYHLLQAVNYEYYDEKFTFHKNCCYKRMHNVGCLR